jgi:hypothetical protein
MTDEINLYDGYYGHLATDPQVKVRRETYGEDLGQASWITASEARRWFDLLHLPCREQKRQNPPREALGNHRRQPQRVRLDMGLFSSD